MLAPQFLSRLLIDADEKGVFRPVAIDAVEASVLGDRDHEVRAEVGVGPDGLGGEVFGDVQQQAAGPVAFGDEDVVAHDDRRGGVDRFAPVAAPRVAEIDLAVGRIDAKQTARGRTAFPAGKDQHPALAVKHGRHGRGITRAPLVAGVPGDLSGLDIKCNHARPVVGPDIDDEQAAFDQWRSSDAEEALPQLVFEHQIVLPARLASL